MIQFMADADIESGRFEGRVEHVSSTKAAHFHTLDELLTFLARTLKDVRAEPLRQLEELPTGVSRCFGKKS